MKTIDTFDFDAQASVNRELVRGEYVDRRENVLLAGNSGTGKTHLATALAFAACAKGKRVRFFSTTGLVTELGAETVRGLRPLPTHPGMPAETVGLGGRTAFPPERFQARLARNARSESSWTA